MDSIDNTELLALALGITLTGLQLADGGYVDWSNGFEIGDENDAVRLELTRAEMMDLVRGLAGQADDLEADAGSVDWSLRNADGTINLQVDPADADGLIVTLTADERQTLVQRLALSLIG